MTHDQVQQIAHDSGYGHVQFETRIALNTGRPFEAGFVVVDGKRQLFCKWSRFEAGFYFCNEFRKLTETV
jgi:hypothetical protein